MGIFSDAGSCLENRNIFLKCEYLYISLLDKFRTGRLCRQIFPLTINAGGRKGSALTFLRIEVFKAAATIAAVLAAAVGTDMPEAKACITSLSPGDEWNNRMSDPKYENRVRQYLPFKFEKDRT